MSSRKQENYRSNDITEAYIKAILEKMENEGVKTDKSKLHREAVALLANHVLSKDELQNIQLELLFNTQSNILKRTIV